MHLSPREIDKLQLHQVGVLAQKRLARGVCLNQPEAVALIATVILEFIRDGNKSVAELMTLGQQLLGRRQVMPGVADMVAEVQVEGTFADGSKLVTIHHPIAAENGDLAVALYGSFLPVPDLSVFAKNNLTDVNATPAFPEPGCMAVAKDDIIINANRPTLTLTVTNLADRPIQVGSHYHFIEVNPYLRFDRAKSYGKRLDIIAGTAVRFEPGETKTVQLVDIAGNRVIRGGNNIADGAVSEAGLVAAMERVVAGNFAHQTQP